MEGNSVMKSSLFCVQLQLRESLFLKCYESIVGNNKIHANTFYYSVEHNV